MVLSHKPDRQTPFGEDGVISVTYWINALYLVNEKNNSLLFLIEVCLHLHVYIKRYQEPSRLNAKILDIVINLGIQTLELD